MGELADRDFQEIYLSTKAQLLAIARRSVLCDADAEDVLHNAFTRFFERKPELLGREEARHYLGTLRDQCRGGSVEIPEPPHKA